MQRGWAVRRRTATTDRTAASASASCTSPTPARGLHGDHPGRIGADHRRRRRQRSGSTSSGPSVRDASDVSDGATWLGGVLSTLGLAVLFGSFVLIVVAWPEGPEYILAVRFLRSVWILTFVGTLLYVVALSAAVNDESLGNGLSPATWLDLLDAGWAGRAAIARLVLVSRDRLGRAAARAGHRPDDAAAGDRHPDARRADDRARRAPAATSPSSAWCGHRPRPRDGGLVRRGRAARPRRARRARRGGPRPGRARVRAHLRTGDRGHRRQRSRPAVPARRRLAVQRVPRPGAAPQDGVRRDHAVRRADRPPGRPGSARRGPRPVAADGRPAAAGVRHRGRDRGRRDRAQRVADVVHAAEGAGERRRSTTPSRSRSSTTERHRPHRPAGAGPRRGQPAAGAVQRADRGRPHRPRHRVHPADRLRAR